jgi:hypothetical protein
MGAASMQEPKALFAEVHRSGKRVISRISPQYFLSRIHPGGVPSGVAAIILADGFVVTIFAS